MLNLLVLASALIAPVCDTANLVQHVQTVRTSLFSIQESPDDLPIDAPPLAQRGVPELRTALSTAITSYMQCEAAATTDLESLQSGLAKLLNANHPESAAEQQRGYPDHTYGDDLKISVQAFRSNGNIAVDANFSTGCGQDHVLLLFNRQSDHWFRTLDWHSEKYTKPS